MTAYVTEAEAETYFEDDPRATAFIALDFAWYLTEATRHIDALPLRGGKYDLEQDLEFPRIIDGIIVGDYLQNATVPDAVKRACMEEAMAIYLAGASGSIQDLQAQGIQSMSVGDKLSYTFVAGAGKAGLKSQAAAKIMRRYTGAMVR